MMCQSLQNVPKTCPALLLVLWAMGAAAPVVQAQTTEALSYSLPPMLDARLAALMREPMLLSSAPAKAETGGPYTPRALSCSINVACPEGSGNSSAIRSTVRIVQGGETCSGVLLNNTQLDGIPYVLTARHCGNPSVGQEVTWTFQFNYESATCADPAETPVAYSISGATVLAAQNGLGDFALLRLSQPIPESFDVVFAGWSITNNIPSSSVVIGHPKQDIKKITLEDDPLVDADDSWVATFDRGSIESGSSGAPLFNGSQQVIGHVRSAITIDYEACSGPDGDDNGPTILLPKLSTIWNMGPSGARVSDFLDPEGSGRSTLDPIEGTSVLPVELTHFDALVDGSDVMLRWETASETNNAGFEMQRISKNDGAAPLWQVIGFVEGYGTTALPQSYQYRVTALDPGAYTFRLKQIDYDGTFEYHPAVEALVEVPTAYMLTAAYPNPFNPEAQFRLSVGQRQGVRVEIYNALGQIVAPLFEGTMEADVTRTFTIDGGTLPSGLYLVRVAGETFLETQTVTLLK